MSTTVETAPQTSAQAAESGAAAPQNKARAYYWPSSGRVVAATARSEIPADATPLPEPGEVVNLSGAALGDWIGLVEPVTGPQVTARLHRNGVVSTHSVQVSSLHADRVVIGSADQPATFALKALSTAYADADRAQQEQNWWKASLVEDAHEWANSNDLCSRFDEFMREHDLPARVFDHRAEVDVTVTLTLTVTGHDDDQARDQVDRELVIDALNDRSSLDLVSFEVVSVERD
ncbi:hypothetical protein ACFV9C_44015 [Kribbella sp. NPDC059898]|uniref:hypothetical protein n=1 Tax=Kribbella sp. NPDC059898 TaxID=3346995 RepID=UPI0036464656